MWHSKAYGVCHPHGYGYGYSKTYGVCYSQCEWQIDDRPVPLYISNYVTPKVKVSVRARERHLTIAANPERETA